MLLPKRLLCEIGEESWLMAGSGVLHLGIGVNMLTPAQMLLTTPLASSTNLDRKPIQA
jgi:hypothetical protein